MNLRVRTIRMEANPLKCEGHRRLAAAVIQQAVDDARGRAGLDYCGDATRFLSHPSPILEHWASQAGIDVGSVLRKGRELAAAGDLR
jgi:hypothetical protein